MKQTRKPIRWRRVSLLLIPVLICTGILAVLFFGESLGLFVHADEPAQTYDIRSAEDFIAYSQAYASGDRNPKDVLNISINSGSVVTDDGFISLGTSSRPFAGTLVIPHAGVDTFHLFDCPLFNYVSTDLKITGAGTLKIIRERVNEQPAAGVLTQGSLFANHVVTGTDPANWTIALLPYEGEGNESSSFAGVIGDIAANADVTVSFTNTAGLAVSGTGNTGLICGTLNEGATLAVTTAGSGGNIAVSSTGGHTGSLVGQMKSGSTLKLNSANNSRVNSVSTTTGYAGGLVGHADEATVEWAAGVTDYAVSGTVTGKTGAGGIFGYYRTTDSPATFDLDQTFSIASGINLSSTNYTGGVFGMLVNEGALFTFDGNSASESLNINLTGGANRGGVCGAYTTNLLTNEFEIKDVNVTPVAAQTTGALSAGLIGTIYGSNPAYVRIHDVSVTSGGTPDAGLIGSVGSAGSFADLTGNVTVSGNFDAGLIKNMEHGVLRMQGLVDMGAYVRYAADSGLIVKNRDRALIYALGDGSGTNGNWTLKRNTTQTVDDIHSWGEVIRTDGTILKESDLFEVSMSAHTVTVKEAHTTIDNVTKFAKTALNMKLNTGAGVGALQFTSGSANLASTLNAATFNLEADISLAGTGLTGFQRDDGNLKNWGGATTNTSYTGTFNGKNHTIALATGENYGLQANGSALDASSKQGNIHQHMYNGLFARTGGSAAVNDLTVSGVVKLNQSLDNIKFGGVTACATQNLTLSNVTCDESVRLRVLGDFNGHFGGAIGIAQNNNLNVSMTNCTMSPTFTEASDAAAAAGSSLSYVGGAIGYVYEPAANSYTQNVDISDSALNLTYNKTGNTDRASIFGGVIAGISSGTYVKDRRTVTLDNLTVDVTASGHTRDRRLGGILGFHWYAADVSLDGVTMNANITANGNGADYGGLARSATGHWDVKDISFGTVNYNVPSSGSTFGVGVNKAYLVDGEVEGALYMDVNDAGYDIGSLTFTGSPSFSVFDEVCADSRFNEADITTNGQAIISVTTSPATGINTSGTVNVYQNKTAYGKTAAGAKNPNTRYYYNMEYARTHTATPKYNFLTWSGKVYAHDSLDAWFASSNTFTGDLDMTGLSYYPVDLPEGVTFNNATLKLDNNLMETRVSPETAGTRSTRASDNQHYLMHTAVFRNDPTAGINISGLTIQGNVPKLSDSFCGFLVAGTLGGAEKDKVKFTGSNITFDGAYITDNGAYFTNSSYAPLLINTIGKNSTLSINGAVQSTTAYSSFAGNGRYAASSLIGNVGNDQARAIYLTFTGLKFDGRSSASSIGNLDTAYGTTKSIFSRATILNSFQYFSESSGSYNYEVDEDWPTSTATHNVTYGKEVSTSVEFADKQHNYYDSEYYTDPVTYHAGSAYNFSTGFLPHVYVAYNAGQYQHELSVNVTFSSVIEGHGKYDSPYIIDDDDKLPIISRIIKGEDVGTSVQIYLPSDLTSYDHTKTTYTKGYLYNFGTSNFTSSNGGTAFSNANVRQYLAGAYYVIPKDITLPDGDNYKSLGDVSDPQYAFRGLLIGRGNPTITNRSRNPLIKTSMGCVVKDLTVDVDVSYNSTTEIALAAPLGSGTYDFSGGNQTYGAVIAQILGGDTIIDNVDVTFTNATFNITAASSNNYVRLVPVGGYVGTLVNGGLMFRNMDSSKVGLTASTFNKVTDAGYLYVNPIIGRVIAGYAFHETSTANPVSTAVNNGSKNYSIADITLSGGKITVTDSSSQFTITVPDGQCLFLLGAAVNSGACCATTAGTIAAPTAYPVLTAFWQAYRNYTTVRGGASYTDVGTATGADYTQACLDKFANTNRQVIPYIIRAYTTTDNSALYMRMLSGRANNKIQITGNCDVSSGFRGIGSHYYDSDNVRLRISALTGGTFSSEASKTISFHTDVRDYETVKVSAYQPVANTAGLGLFNVLKMTSASETNSVRNLELAGSIFYDLYTITGTQSLYNYGSGTNQVSSDEYLAVGGIGGLVNTSVFFIKDVTFNNLNVEGAKCAGGFVGYITITAATTSPQIKFSDGVANAGYINAVGGLAAGGLVGKVYKARLEVDGSTSGGTDIIVRNVEVKATSLHDSGTMFSNWTNNISTGAGGIVGCFWGRHNDNNGAETDTLRDGSSSANPAKRVYINYINVVKGTYEANIRVRNDTEDPSNYNTAGGFIGTTHNSNLHVYHCKLLNVNVRANMAGGILGFSTQKVSFKMDDILIDGTDGSHTIQGNAIAGGVVGRFRGRDSVCSDINHVTVTNYTIESLSTSSTVGCAAGGILGDANGDNLATTAAASHPFEFRNAAVSHCTIKTNYTDGFTHCGTGGLIGTATPGKKNESSSTKYPDYTTPANRVKVSGYNILLDDLTLVHLNGGSTNQSTAASGNRRIGDIIGNNSAGAGIKLVGVTTSNMDYIGKHAGYYNSTNDNYGDGGTGFGTGFAVFADYDGVQTNESFASIADGSTDADDYTNVVNSEPYVTSNPALTVNGTLLTGDGVAGSVANLSIQEILTDGTSGRYEYAATGYYTGSSGDTNHAAFNAFTSKFTMFSTEVSGYLGTDFPVLIVDDTTRANTTREINSYIRLLTNTREDYGTDVAGKYEVKIYNMVYENGVFTPSAVGASLKREYGQFYMLNSTFDSGKSQFSLVDVRFFDPVKTTDTAYHLYIPVFVKKVLSYQFDIAQLSGTTYLDSIYTPRIGQALIENIGMPVTLNFRYTYSRTPAEWAEAINAGENVDRNYAKSLLFYKANTNDCLKNFPANTVLVLVDPDNGGKPYYATFGEAMTGNTLNLSAFKSTMTPDGAGGYTFSGDSFTPQTLSNMMTLSAATTGTESDTMVQCPANEATVTVNGQGYRLATDEDTGTKYTISVSDMETEEYYLSIYTESNAVNDELFHYYLVTSPTSFSETEYPSKITDTGAHTLVHTVMGKIFYHSALTVNSQSSQAPSLIMTDSNNALTVNLSAQFGLSDDLDADIKTNLQSLIAATDVYQSYLVILNRRENGAISKVILGEPTVTGSYETDYTLNATADSALGAYAAANIRTTQNFAELVTGDLSDYFASGNKFEINATATITYPTAAIPTQFPGQGDLPPSDTDGVTVSAASNIAFQQYATTYSKNTIGMDETPAKIYHSEKPPEVAELHLNPVGDKVGDFTPLGINALNNGDKDWEDFDLLAVLDVTQIADRISEYADARVTIQLTQKQPNGVYGSPLDISEYLTCEFEGQAAMTDNGLSYTTTITRANLDDNGAEITFPMLHCEAKTGDALEADNLKYANYTITVTVILRNGNGVGYLFSQAQNYVVYTNAKIIPEYVNP